MAYLNGKEEVLLTRLKGPILNTCYTHGYLMNKKEKIEHETFGVHLTIKHIISSSNSDKQKLLLEQTQHCRETPRFTKEIEIENLL